MCCGGLKDNGEVDRRHQRGQIFPELGRECVEGASHGSCCQGAGGEVGVEGGLDGRRGIAGGEGLPVPVGGVDVGRGGGGGGRGGGREGGMEGGTGFLLHHQGVVEGV